MHPTPHQNLFGVTTYYGTHPKQPTRAATRVRTVADRAVTYGLAAMIAAGRMLGRLRRS